MDAAWQTYHAKACEQLTRAQDSPTESSAQMAVGWALLALVEVLKPQQVEPSPPEAWCGETTPHDEHLWEIRRRCRGAIGVPTS